MMNLQSKSYNLRTGFTLIELLVVIAIIGLLASIVMASLGTARNKAADAAIMADLAGIRAAAEIYYGNNGNYGRFPDNVPLAEALCPTGDVAGTSVFEDTNILRAISSAQTQSGGVTRCGASDGGSYAILVELRIRDSSNNPQYYCVDSTGKIGTVTGSTLNAAIAGVNTTIFSCLL